MLNSTTNHFKGGFIIYQRMLSEYQRLEEQIKQVEAYLDSLPDGKLICSQNQGRYKWYSSDGHVRTYIPKKDRFFAEQLAIKKYLSLFLEDLVNEKRAIQFYLNHHHMQSGKAERLLSSDSGYQELLSGYFTPLSQELADWMNEPYQSNPSHPEHLIHKSFSNHFLRSKSEAFIDYLLYTNKIPYRYECALTLGDVTFFPDFTIRHPRTGKIYYWEHFGLMDHEEYAKKVYAKLRHYADHQIIPSINLITTYETKDNPLDPEMIQKIIQYYFL